MNQYINVYYYMINDSGSYDYEIEYKSHLFYFDNIEFNEYGNVVYYDFRGTLDYTWQPVNYPITDQEEKVLIKCIEINHENL